MFFEKFDDILYFLKLLGFSLKDGVNKTIYEKAYQNNYVISIELYEKDFRKSKINYGNITYDRETSLTFNQNESFVVLECVNRLLDKGYSPEEIILEKAYSAGKKEKGQYADILVKKGTFPYYIIECKTYGDEYEKALKETKENGGANFDLLHKREKCRKSFTLYFNCKK